MANPVQPTTDSRPLPLTQALGRFVADITFERLPKLALRAARTGFIAASAR